MPRLLIVDDRDQMVEMCHRHLPQFEYVTRCHRGHPCQVCEERERDCPFKCAHDYGEAAAALSQQATLPDLVVLDLHFAIAEPRLLPEDKTALPPEPKKRRAALEELRRKQGLYILERLRQGYPALPVILLTTRDIELGDQRPTDPFIYFCENEIVDSRTLAAEITRALGLCHAEVEGGVFWGRSRAMADLRRSVEIWARSPLPLLIQGETGTGKSFLAENVIHPRSGVKGPLIVTDLSTIPMPLIPAHLFGTRRGAYTGAVEDHPGVFEQAHGGTLFLDEIANLDLEVQRQLLLVLERGIVTRLGDARPRAAAVKLIAATNQDLAALVRAGKFRADLYMRLNPAARLRLPPLRERQADLADLLRFALLTALNSEALLPLARSFLSRFPTPEDFRGELSAVIVGKPSERAARKDAFTIFVSQRVLGRLARHDWPGNHRELKLLATNALVYTFMQHLETEIAATGRAPAILHLPERLFLQLLGEPPAPAIKAPVKGPSGQYQIPVVISAKRSFAELSAAVERQYFEALFQETAGDLEQMARILLGPTSTGRQVHLRLNQIGLRIRELRGRSR